MTASQQPRGRGGRFAETPGQEWEGELGGTAPANASPAPAPPPDQWTGSFRDSLPDDEYNAEFDYTAPPRPRSPEQVVAFWRAAVKDYPKEFGADMGHVQDGLDDRRKWYKLYYARESGTMPSDFPGWTYKQKQAAFDKTAKEWVNSIPDPRNTDTPRDITIAVQLYTDAAWSDRQNGMDVDDPHSMTHRVGRLWQTSSGRAPREIVAECRLYNVHNTTFLDLYENKNPTWRGGRTYVPHVLGSGKTLFL